MDDSAFDRLTRFLGTTPTRRDGLGLAITAALGAVASLLDRDDAGARGSGKGMRQNKSRSNRQGSRDRSRNTKWHKQRHDHDHDIESEKKKGKGKGKKKKPKDPPQNPPQSPPPPDAPTWKPCIGCNACQTCTDGEGVCRPDPSKNGWKCSGCFTCRDGACNAPDDTLCQDHQRCRASTGICCPICQSDGSCCPVGSSCVDPGLFSSNFCCDTDENDVCGSNGDGTFKVCCPRDTHRCLDDKCVRRGECPDGWKLCPGGNQSFCAPEDFSCCGTDACNTFQECCDAEKGLCCLKGICAGGKCCTGDREICGNQCCDFGKVCCGSECCHASQCVNETCCPRGVCGDPAGFSRVCPTEQEFCCFAGPHGSMSGYACPRGDGSQADCAPDGKCCPAGTIYNTSCDLCCEDLFIVCEHQRCVPPTPGRFS